jgi:hypothetical protein
MDPFDLAIAIVKQMMTMLDAHHERKMAPLGKTEAPDFKAIPEEMESNGAVGNPQCRGRSDAGRRSVDAA